MLPVAARPAHQSPFVGQIISPQPNSEPLRGTVEIVGIATHPNFWKYDVYALTGRAEDEWIPIVTGIRCARNVIITRTAQAVIAVGGSYGTLSEIAFALSFSTPVVGLGTWEIKREGHPLAPIVYAATPEEAVKRALALARGQHT